MTYKTRKRTPPHIRVLDKTLVGDGCWEYGGSADSRGYGRVFVEITPEGKNKLALAHRAVYEAMVGPIPDGMLLCHHCDNPRCVRPDHVFVGSAVDNSRDMCAKGRQGSGPRPHTKRTHCPNGHPYSDDNLYLDKHGWSHCRTCRSMRSKSREVPESIPEGDCSNEF